MSCKTCWFPRNSDHEWICFSYVMCAVKVFLHSQSQPQYKLSIITSKVDCYLDVLLPKISSCPAFVYNLTTGFLWGLLLLLNLLSLSTGTLNNGMLSSFFVGLESGLVGQVLIDESKWKDEDDDDDNDVEFRSETVSFSAYTIIEEDRL